MSIATTLLKGLFLLWGCAEVNVTGRFTAMIRLSPRLQLFYDLLLPGEDVWDLCCDHGMVGMKALESGCFGRISFVDQVPHLIEALREKIDVEAKADFFPIPAEDLSWALQGSVVIAGVGGHKVFSIVRSLKDSGRLQAKRLVLSPHRDEDLTFRKLKELLRLDWTVSDELHFQEGHRTRPLWVFERVTRSSSSSKPLLPSSKQERRRGPQSLR